MNIFSSFSALRSSALKAVVMGACAFAFTPLTVRAQPSPVIQTFGNNPTGDANYTFTNVATSGATGSATFAANIASTGSFEIGYFTNAIPAAGNQALKGTGAFGIFNNNNGNVIYTTQLDFAEKLFRQNSGLGSTTLTKNRLDFNLASYNLGGGSKGFDALTSVKVLLSINGGAYTSAFTVTGNNTNNNNNDYFNFKAGSATADSQDNASITPAQGEIILTLPPFSTADTRVAVRIIISTSNRSQILVSNVSLISGNNTPLPVELTRFEATAKGQSVNLNWATASEKNSDRFEVQRSATGEVFETVGTVKGQGNTSSAHNYAFVDSRPLAGRSYYRLRQVDTDGTTAFSPVATVQLRNELAVYPNPSAGIVTLPATLGDVRYRLLNTIGQTLLSGQATGNDQLDLTKLAKGTFFLELTGEAGRTTQRLVRE
jgi:hypothetical protein